MGPSAGDRLRTRRMALPGVASLILLVSTAMLVGAEVPARGVGARTCGALISFAPEATSGLPSSTTVTPLQVSGFVHAYSDRWAPDETTDTEQYLDIVLSDATLVVQVTNDQDDVGPPAVAQYPIETIVVAWAGPDQVDLGRWNNIEYATFDVAGHPVLPITQVTDIGPAEYGDEILTADPVPAVGPTNGNVLLAWRLLWDYAGPSPIITEIYSAVRGTDGAEIRGPSLIASAEAHERGFLSGPAAAAFRNGFFLVAWSVDYSFEHGDIHYVVLDRTGDLRLSPTNLTNNPVGQNDGDVRATRLASGHVLLTWTGQHGLGQQIYYAVLDSAGRLVHAPSRVSDAPNGAGGSDAVGFLSGNIIVAWEQSGDQAGESQIAYAMLNETYTTTLPLPMATRLLTNTLEAENYAVSLARDADDNAVLTWQGGGDQYLYAAVVGNDGLVRSGPEVLREAHGTSLSVGVTGTGCGSLPTAVRPLALCYLPLVSDNSGR
ncbi:MAG: hypothetical protein M8467_12490 [Anaerolineae bacterium]|nr:hypothetical protein [Anaerolineae bacterium]